MTRTLKRLLVAVAPASSAAVLVTAQTASKTLDVYLIDTEGGQAGHTGDAHWIKISARNHGTFTVTNSRNNFTKTYVKR